LDATIEATLGSGAICFIGAGLLALFTRAAIDKDRLRRWLAADTEPPGVAASRPAHPLSTPIALLCAAALLYLPANLYPIATIPVGFSSTAYTVLGGIRDLAAAHFIGLALLVFCASLAVPILKIAGLAWCCISVLRKSPHRLVLKTRIYRWLAEIGRWSMVDPFTIACFVPVLNYNRLIESRADAAALPFAAVVVLTTIAAKSFDPRRLWDPEPAN
jgi:paraquat-inducible protein A